MFWSTVMSVTLETDKVGKVESTWSSGKADTLSVLIGILLKKLDVIWN